MKLIRFGKIGAEKPGVLWNGKRLDCSDWFKDWDRDFFQNGGLKKLNKLLKRKGAALAKISKKERWGSPIARPGMIMCIGLNYSDHAKESGMEIPKEPIIFMKATNTIAGPYDDVPIPKNSKKTDWEVELGIVLKNDVSYLKNEKEAAKSIAGYCVVNDLSERQFQLEKGGQWVKGKSCPGFSPVGPFLLTKDEVFEADNLKMKLWVNGKKVQNGNTKTMIFKPTYIVWYLSQFMKLEAGDLISTGTPYGVGFGMKPPRYLKAGDQVELEIEQLGRQKQLFIKSK